MVVEHLENQSRRQRCERRPTVPADGRSEGQGNNPLAPAFSVLGSRCRVPSPSLGSGEVLRDGGCATPVIPDPCRRSRRQASRYPGSRMRGGGTARSARPAAFQHRFSNPGAKRLPHRGDGAIGALLGPVAVPGPLLTHRSHVFSAAFGHGKAGSESPVCRAWVISSVGRAADS